MMLNSFEYNDTVTKKSYENLVCCSRKEKCVWNVIITCAITQSLKIKRSLTDLHRINLEFSVDYIIAAISSYLRVYTQ